MVVTMAEHEAEMGRLSRERHQAYKDVHSERKCLKCALKLNEHTVEEFQYCEFVLAGGGQETLVTNRPDDE